MIPDWLWQGMTIWAAGKSIELTWKHRRTIAEILKKAPEDINVYAEPMTLRAEAQHALVTAEATLDASWKVEAPTPSLARRLEEVAAWYLHVS